MDKSALTHVFFGGIIKDYDMNTAFIALREERCCGMERKARAVFE